MSHRIVEHTSWAGEAARSATIGALLDAKEHRLGTHYEASCEVMAQQAASWERRQPHVGESAGGVAEASVAGSAAAPPGGLGCQSASHSRSPLESRADQLTEALLREMDIQVLNLT